MSDAPQPSFVVATLAETETNEELKSFFKQDFEVIYHHTPKGFMSFLSRNPCHLLIIEINSSSFDGFEWKKRARQLAPSTSLIFLARERDLEAVARSNRQGADYLFFFPLDWEPFGQAIQTMLRRRNYWLQLAREVQKGST